MTTYTTIPDTDIAQDKPIKAETGLALRDNALAIQEGDASAPSITLAIAAKTAAYGIGSYTIAYSTGTANIAYGATVAGSTLRTASASRGETRGTAPAGPYADTTFPAGLGLTGTWRCMGSYWYREQVAGSANPDTQVFMYGATLFLRIL